MSKSSHTSNSCYPDLYRSIEEMRNHGMKNNDSRMVQLATTLIHKLTHFESHPNKKNPDFKNNFRIQFLATLHRDEKALNKQSNPAKPFLGAIYKAFYLSVFSAQKINSLSSLAQAQHGTEQVDEPKEGFRP